jgi:hypothetical protein
VDIEWLYGGFEVLTAVAMKNSIFCDITTCRPAKDNRSFAGTYLLHHQGGIVNQATTRHKASNKQNKPPAERTQEYVD